MTLSILYAISQALVTGGVILLFIGVHRTKPDTRPMTPERFWGSLRAQGAISQEQYEMKLMEEKIKKLEKVQSIALDETSESV